MQPVSLPAETGQPRFRRNGPERNRLITCLSFGYDKREQGDRPRPLDRYGQFPLVFGAVSRNPPRHDLASLRREIPERLSFLIFDLQIGVRTEAAELPPVKEFLLWSRPLGTS